LLAVIGEQAKSGLAQRHRLVENGVEHRREVAGRGVDDTEHLGGGGLLLQGLVALGTVLLPLGKCLIEPPLQLTIGVLKVGSRVIDCRGHLLIPSGRGSGAWEFYSTPLGDRKPSFDRLIAEIGLSGVASGRQCPLRSYRHRKPGKSGTAESPSWRPAMTRRGNEDQFPPSSLSSRFGLGEATLAGTRDNGRDAP
jgi:hypothetical protein